MQPKHHKSGRLSLRHGCSTGLVARSACQLMGCTTTPPVHTLVDSRLFWCTRSTFGSAPCAPVWYTLAALMAVRTLMQTSHLQAARLICAGCRYSMTPQTRARAIWSTTRSLSGENAAWRWRSGAELTAPATKPAPSTRCAVARECWLAPAVLVQLLCRVRVSTDTKPVLHAVVSWLIKPAAQAHGCQSASHRPSRLPWLRHP